MSSVLTSLQRGIAAIKAQNHEEARKHLVLAISNNPEDAEPWLWLGIVATNLDERIQYLEQAVSLEPDNHRATTLLSTLHQQQIEAWIQNGIVEIKAGNAQQGADLLTKAVNQDETQLEAWWWLGQALDSPEEKSLCYENVITLDPEHSGALLALKSLKQIESDATIDLFRQEIKLSNPSNNLPNSIASTFEDNVSGPPQAVVMSFDNQVDDLLNSELLCPFCAAKTKISDKRCPECNLDLMLRKRPITQPKPQYKILIGLEFGILIFSFLVALVMLGYIDLFVQKEGIGPLLRLYFQSGGQSWSTLVDNPLAIISPLAFYTALIPAIIAILVIIIVFFRWNPSYYISLAVSTVRILVCVLSFVLVSNGLTTNASVILTKEAEHLLVEPMRYILLGVLGFSGLLSIISLFLLVNCHDHFYVKTSRRVLRLDDDVFDSSTGLRQRARVYAKEKAWALAALHARESILLNQAVEGYTLLATAYYNLGLHKEVTETIRDAIAFSPNNSQLIELQEVLDYQMTGTSSQ